jgi:hypothetical protein
MVDDGCFRAGDFRGMLTTLCRSTNHFEDAVFFWFFSIGDKPERNSECQYHLSRYCNWITGTWLAPTHFSGWLHKRRATQASE